MIELLIGIVLAIGAGLLIYHFKAKVEADVKTVLADVKAELAKATPSLSAIGAKIEGLFKKL